MSRFFSNISISLLFLLAGCAANALLPEASKVQVLDAVPDKNTCTFIGEVVGDQGNWFTGGYTSNKNLIIGARNTIKNEAYKLGGNAVYFESMSNTNYYGAGGTSNTTIVGKAYKCK